MAEWQSRGTLPDWTSTFTRRSNRRDGRKSSHMRFRASVVRDSRLFHSAVNLRPCELSRAFPRHRRLPHCRLAVTRNGDSLLTIASCFKTAAVACYRPRTSFKRWRPTSNKFRLCEMCFRLYERGTFCCIYIEQGTLEQGILLWMKVSRKENRLKLLRLLYGLVQQ